MEREVRIGCGWNGQVAVAAGSGEMYWAWT